MTDYVLPDLPSDEELGIAGLSEEDLSETPPSPSPARPDGGGPEPPASTPAEPAATLSGGPRWRGWVTLAVLLVGGWLSSSYRHLPAPQAANAADSLFSSGRALTHLVEIARRPHPTGAPELDSVREFVVRRLEELGLDPEVQEVTQLRPNRSRASAATVRNVLARVPGTESTGAILVTAHYDAVPGSPGAGDDGTGVATILEALRALQAGAPLRNDLIVLFTDAEELGLMGASAFVERHPWMAGVRLALSVEMRGGGGPSIMFETGPENGWIIERLEASDPRPMANSISTEIYRRLPNDTDFSPFRDAGVQGLNFAAIGKSRVYHQPSDTPENVEEATVQHHGMRLLAMLRALGREDLGSVHGPDRAFTVLPFAGMISYPVGFAIPGSLALVFALLIVTFLASLRGTRSRGFLLSAILSAVAMAMSAAAGWAILRWLVPMHEGASLNAMVPLLHSEAPYFVAITAIAIGITMSLFSLGHRWMKPLEATLGALLLPVLALLAATLMAPAAAINLQGPMAATVLLLALLTGVGLHRAQGTVAWIASLVLALPVLAFAVPVLELLGVALSLRAAPVLGALVAFFLLFVLPALSALERPNRWWAPATAFATALVALGIGWVGSGHSETRPAPSTLLYAMDRSPDGTPERASWATLPGVGADWAEDAVDAEFADTARLEDYGLGGRTYLTAEAPLAAVAPPTVRVLSDTVVAGVREVVLGIRSGMGAEMIRVDLPEALSFVSVWGASSGGPDSDRLGPSVRSLEHWGRPEPELRVALSGAPGAEWTIGITEHHLRPEEVFGEGRFERPTDLVSQANAGSDRVVVRTPFRVGSRTLDGSATGASPAVADPLSPDRDSLTIAVDSLARGDTLAPPDTGAAPDSAAGSTPPDTVRTAPLAGGRLPLGGRGRP